MNKHVASAMCSIFCMALVFVFIAAALIWADSHNKKSDPAYKCVNGVSHKRHHSADGVYYTPLANSGGEKQLCW